MINRRNAELAKAIVVLAFRNGPLEDLHAGKRPCADSGDASVSHITQAEMRDLMRYAVQKVYRILDTLERDPGDATIAMLLSTAREFASAWDDPVE